MIEDCLALFRNTNPDLVADQKDWIGAEFLADREADTVIVVARWQQAESYRRYAESDKFRKAMKEFGQFFEAPPEVRIAERLWRMGDIA